MKKKLQYLFKRFFFYLKRRDFKSILYKFFIILTGKNKIDLDKINFDSSTTLDELFLKFGSDKGKFDGKKTYDNLTLENNTEFRNYEDWIKRDNPYEFNYQLGHNFTSIYEKIFQNLKDKRINFLEIGVANGHSIASWYKYFPNAFINGIDIKKKDKLFYKGSRLSYNSLDCLNQKQVSNFLKKNEKFDVIVDDSSHTPDAFFYNIKNFYKHLKNGGIYILEDFRISDLELKLVKKFNKDNGGVFLQRNKHSVEEVFDSILKKEKFKHHILNSNDFDFIFDNTKESAIINTENPIGALAILFRK